MGFCEGGSFRRRSDNAPADGRLFAKTFAPSAQALLPLVLSIVAVAVSLVSAFKNELFGFRLHIVPGELTLAVPSEPSHRSFAIVYALSFVNNGYAEGIVEWVALRIHGPGSTKLYTPIAEVDFEKLLQGRRALHAENIKGAFSPFVVGSKEASRRFILFSQEENDPKYPFNEWQPGKHQFEVWVKSDSEKRPRLVATEEFELSQTLIDNCFRGQGAVMMNRKIELP